MIPVISIRNIKAGNTIQAAYTSKPPTRTTASATRPINIMAARIINPIIREKKPIIINPAKSSRFHLSPLPSTILFQGENSALNNCGIEKKWKVNQMKFFQVLKISKKALE